MNYPVTDLDDAYNACNPEKPLEVGDARYLDLMEVRHDQGIASLAKAIKRTTKKDNEFHKQLVTGHIGCGKSTELKRLQKQLEEQRYFVVFIDVQTSLDINDLTYTDVLLNLAQAIIKALNDNNIDLDLKLLDDLHQWFFDKIVSQEYITDLKASVKAEGKMKVTVPLIAELLTKLTGEAHSRSSQRIEIREKIEQQQQVFMLKLNDLLLAAQMRLKGKGYVDLVIIVDGLEKIKKKAVYDALFLEHSEQLKAINTHVLYTFPVALGFDTNLANFFVSEVFFIPMVKYETQAGKQHLFDLVNKRLDVTEVFAQESFLYDLIAMSGGSVRDLLRLIRFATETETKKIEAEDIDRAIKSLASEYDRLIREGDIPLLKSVKNNKRITKTENREYERLLSCRLVHQYQNGDTWEALHPALTRITWLQKILAEKPPLTTRLFNGLKKIVAS